MSNMNLTRYESDDELEFFIDECTGIAYASQRATARMVGVDEKTIRRFVSTAACEIKTAEIQTVNGLRTAALLTSESVFQAAIKYNEKLAIKMGAMGANSYICHQAGYQLKLESPHQEIKKEVIEPDENTKLFLDVFTLIDVTNLEPVAVAKPKIGSVQSILASTAITLGIAGWPKSHCPMAHSFTSAVATVLKQKRTKP